MIDRIALYESTGHVSITVASLMRGWASNVMGLRSLERYILHKVHDPRHPPRFLVISSFCAVIGSDIIIITPGTYFHVERSVYLVSLKPWISSFCKVG